MQIILGILAIVIIALLLSVKTDNFSQKKKMSIIKTIIAAIVVLWLYEMIVDSTADNNREIVLSFNHGKEIICDDMVISNRFFYYENGTESFVANDKNSSLKDLIYPIQKCEIKSE